MTWFEKIIEAHLRVTAAVSHNRRLNSDRYFCWQEDGANDLHASDIHAEKSVTGTTDLFTKKEFDPWKEQFEQSMRLSGIAFFLNSIQYEEDTGFTHYEWIWNVTGAGT